MASMPLAVETGAHAAAYLGGLLNPHDIARIEHDLATMPRSRIEGADVPRAVAMLIPLCHDVDGVPHVIFTSRPDDFGAPHAGVPDRAEERARLGRHRGARSRSRARSWDSARRAEEGEEEEEEEEEGTSEARRRNAAARTATRSPCWGPRRTFRASRRSAR